MVHLQRHLFKQAFTMGKDTHFAGVITQTSVDYCLSLNLRMKPTKSKVKF